MTAAATTGPAKQPRPTSSQPASIKSGVKEEINMVFKIQDSNFKIQAWPR